MLQPPPASDYFPCACVSEQVKSRLKEQFGRLDPVLLLRDIRAAQQVLSDIEARGPRDRSPTPAATDVSMFLESLATAWKDGEVRPTHRKQPAGERWWRTREDPFAHAWPVIEGWLNDEPTVTAKELLERLAQIVPDAYAGESQLRTLQRRIKAWRAEKAKGPDPRETQKGYAPACGNMNPPRKVGGAGAVRCAPGRLWTCGRCACGAPGAAVDNAMRCPPPHPSPT